MPSKSEAQHNAMEAAAHGHSTLGIPKSVGEEFVAADGDFVESDHPRDEDGKFTSVFHGSNGGEIKNIKTSGTVFNGLFTSKSKESASSHGSYLHEIKIPTSKIATTSSFHEISNKKLEDAFKKVTGLTKKSKNYDDAWEAIVEDNHSNDKAIFESSYFSSGDIDEIGGSSWEAQKLRGELARELGFEAIEMKDEHGLSYLVLSENPNIKLIDKPHEKIEIKYSDKYTSALETLKSGKGFRIKKDEYGIELIGSGLHRDIDGIFMNNKEMSQISKKHSFDSKKKNIDYFIAYLKDKAEDEIEKRNDSNDPNVEVITELDIANKIVTGELPSPTPFHNITFFDLRITGTGAAYRVALNEFVYRPPEEYLNEDFLKRCNGLPVIWIHPDKGIMQSSDFIKRVVGHIFIAYIKDDEVRGVAKIYDEDAIKILSSTQMSTSPGVLFDITSGNTKIELDENKHILIEGVPALIDHLAICEAGVWDKLGAPTGVRIDSQINEGDNMPKEEVEDKEVKKEAETKEEVKADAGGDPTHLNAILDAIGKMNARLDAVDAHFAKKDSEEKPKEVKADAEEDETEVAAMADAQARADSVLQLHGKHAPRPLRGEKLQAYRQRIIKPLQEFSDSLKNIDLSKVADPTAFNHIERQIYNDAQAAASDPRRLQQTLPRGQLREVNKKMGRVDCVEFVGDISGFTNAFSQPSFKGKFIKKDNK